MTERPRVGFVTCVRIGRSVIEAILDMGGVIDVLVTLPDGSARAKSGRIMLDDLATAHDIELIKVSHIDDAAPALESIGLDWLFIIGWSQIAGAEVLSAARHGSVGMHPTLLPQGRGSASIPWAILKGLPETGVTAFQLEAGVDSGPIFDQIVVPVSARETATTLYSRVEAAHVGLVRELWPKLLDGTAAGMPQDDAAATTWPRRRPEDGRFVPDEITVDDLDRLVRASTRPYPGAFFEASDGRLVTAWSGRPDGGAPGDIVLACADGDFTVLEHEQRHAP